MNKFLLFIVAIFFSGSVLQAQALQFLQTNIMAPNSATVLFDMAASKTDNSFYGGGYTASYNTSFPLANGPNMARVFKKDENGNTVWSWTNTTNITVFGAGCYVYSVAADGNGNVYAAGRYNMNNTGQTITIGDTPMPFGNGYFIIKFDASGTILWVQAANGFVLFNSIDTDSDGNLYTLGSVQGNANFGGITVSSSSGFWKDCIVKYDGSGAVQWVKQLGEINLNNTTVSDRGALEHLAVKPGPLPEIYAAGFFLSPYTVDGQTFTSSGAEDALLLKFDNNGNLLDAKREGGANTDYFQNLSVNTAGEIAVPLTYNTSIVVNGQNFSTTAGFNRTIAVKLTSSFGYQWLQDVTANFSTAVMAIDNTGRVAIASGGPFTTGNLSFAFLHFFSASGSQLFSKTVTGTLSPFGGSGFLPNAVFFSASANTDLYMGAIYKPSASVDGAAITCTKNFNHEIAIAKFAVPAGALPLTLLSFSLKGYDEHHIKLEWKTADEINTSHFEVERSADGGNFKAIGRVNARNTAGINLYVFDDEQPLKNKSFYRLRMVDIDGKQTFSPIIKADNNIETLLMAYPSPASGMLVIKSGTKQQLVITDIKGRELMKLTAEAGLTPVQVSALPAGIYLLKTAGGKTIKWVKE